MHDQLVTGRRFATKAALRPMRSTIRLVRTQVPVRTIASGSPAGEVVAGVASLVA
ncbi:hypothetical protein [uncultured Sphingomonas sp.]|uniref:hypothetical protein n=1 Tax=uncultured Sphingomonas sp. TaxID=158754 RepID=UPI00374A60F4